MPGSLKTEAIVLRGIRYGEADRILHLYTPDRGRVSAIAKGVRRAKSRFGGRLEPFFRLNLVLYEGKSRPADGHERGDARRPPAAARARRGARRRRARLRRRRPPVRRRRAARRRLPPARQPARAARPRRRARATRANALAFRLKLLLAAGFAPHLASCASCGEPEHLVGFSGAAGGVVCGACEAGSFALSQEGHDFLVARSGARWPRPGRAARAAQAERAISRRWSTTPTCGCARRYLALRIAPRSRRARPSTPRRARSPAPQRREPPLPATGGPTTGVSSERARAPRHRH